MLQDMFLGVAQRMLQQNQMLHANRATCLLARALLRDTENTSTIANEEQLQFVQSFSTNVLQGSRPVSEVWKISPWPGRQGEK